MTWRPRPSFSKPNILISDHIPMIHLKTLSWIHLFLHLHPPSTLTLTTTTASCFSYICSHNPPNWWPDGSQRGIIKRPIWFCHSCLESCLRTALKYIKSLLFYGHDMVPLCLYSFTSHHTLPLLAIPTSPDTLDFFDSQMSIWIHSISILKVHYQALSISCPWS